MLKALSISNLRFPIKIPSPRKLLSRPKEEEGVDDKIAPKSITLESDHFFSIMFELLITENVDSLIHTLDFVILDIEEDKLVDLWECLHQIRKLAYAKFSPELEEAVTRFEDSTVRR
jgi:hypothetical protein